MNQMVGIMQSAQAAAIEAVGLTKQYREHLALSDVDFRLGRGRMLALIGHNGAGKTTLMKLILGLIRPSRGSLTVFGERPADAGLAWRSKIGFLPENVAFYDELTGRQTLQFYAGLKKVDLRQCDELLERLGLFFAAGRRVKTYSKGMRQRLGLAQALLGTPLLLMLDEPTTGLDPASRAEFFGLVKSLAKAGTTIIISSHILTELEAETDEVAILSRGELRAFGPLSTLREQAGLLVHFLVRGEVDAEALSTGFADLGQLIKGRDGAIEIAVPVGRKMEALGRLANLGNRLTDIDIENPGLDAVYHHFSRETQA